MGIKGLIRAGSLAVQWDSAPSSSNVLRFKETGFIFNKNTEKLGKNVVVEIIVH